MMAAAEAVLAIARSVLKFLGWKGVVGIVGMLGLGLLLVLQKGETRHWKKQSAQFEVLYRKEQEAFALTVANYRAAAAQARADDLENQERVRKEAEAQNKETLDDLQTRLAAARATYQRLLADAQAGAHSGSGSAAAVPGVSGAAEGVDGTSCSAEFSTLACRLTATEQAIRLDALIKWVKGVTAIDTNGPAKAQVKEPDNAIKPN